MNERSTFRFIVGPLVAALALGVGVGPVSSGRAHDFEETRRLVLSVEPDRVELLVGYDLRPGRLAESLVARFDADHDGRATSALERLARAQTLGPRMRHGWSLSVDGRALRPRLADLAFPDAPPEGGRRGVHAVGLYVAPLPRAPREAAPISLVLRTRDARGQLTLEAQAAEGYEMTGTGLESRSGDPVLGPAALTGRGAITLTVSPASLAAR